MFLLSLLLLLLLLQPRWCKGLHDGISKVAKSIFGKHTKKLKMFAYIAIFGCVAKVILNS